MTNFHSNLKHLGQFCSYASPSFMVLAMILISPQQQAFLSLEGDSRFLRSLLLEAQAWQWSHLSMLVAMIVLPFAILRMSEELSPFAPKWSVFTVTVGAIGPMLIIGQLALDYVYAALATQIPDVAQAQLARNAMYADSYIQTLFNMSANILLLLSWFSLALQTLIYKKDSRLTGVFIILGWTTVLALHGTLPFAEVIGHSLILLGIFSFRFSVARPTALKE